MTALGVSYRGWRLAFLPKPGPRSALDWEAVHPEWGEDPDAPYSRRAFTGCTLNQCLDQIDALEAERASCIACGAEVWLGQLCHDCYLAGRTCGEKGENE